MLLADQPHSASNHSHAGVRRLAAADGQAPTDIHTRAIAAAPTAPAGRGTDAPPRPGSRRVTPVPLTVPRVLAVIATSLVRRVLWCGSLIGWFLRSIRCSGRAWRLGSSSTMPRSLPVVIASKAPAGWLRWEVFDLVEAGTSRVGV